MKTITVHVQEPVYRDFQRLARAHGRPTSELIREAMADYRERRLHERTSLREWQPTSAGRVLRPLTKKDDLLSEMLEDRHGKRG